MSHEHYRRLVAGMVLDDLDPREAAALGRHLETCRSCRADLRALGETVCSIGLAVPPRRPPAVLARRVAAAISGLVPPGSPFSAGRPGC
jgi:anti-sigma factor RsiW